MVPTAFFQFASKLGSDSILVQFDAEVSLIHEENQRHGPLRSYHCPRRHIVERTEIEDDRLVIRVRGRAEHDVCPDCGAVSRRGRNRYWRRAEDLPLGGRRVELQVMVRRFLCASTLCTRRVFAKRLAAGSLAPLARRTERLEHIVHYLGLALGCPPAAAITARLMAQVSNDTLIRVVRRRTRVPSDPR